jgi:type 1 glutamine amidotransferase
MAQRRIAIILIAASTACFSLQSPRISAGEKEPKRLLLLGQSPDGHPKTTHEYMAGQKIVAALLKDTRELTTEIVNADEPWEKGPELLDKADGAVIFLSEGAKWLSADPRRLEAFARLAQRGGGLAALHWGMGTREAEPVETFVKLVGGCHGGPDRKFAVVSETAQPTDHEIAHGVKPFRVEEEWYYRLKLYKTEDEAHAIQPIVRVKIDGADETVCWAWERPDGGRSFGFSGLHFHENWKQPAYRRLVKQGVFWMMRQPLPEKGASVEIERGLLELE